MLVMSLDFTIGAWLVNFTHFAYLQLLHILTFAFFVKNYCKINLHLLFTHKIIYRQTLHRLRNCGDKSCKIFHVNFLFNVLTEHFVLVINTSNKIPRKKDRNAFFQTNGKT